MKLRLEKLEDRVVPSGLSAIAVGDVNGAQAPSLIAANVVEGQDTVVRAVYGGEFPVQQADFPSTVNDAKPIHVPTGLLLQNLTAFPGYQAGVSLVSADFNVDGYDDIAVGVTTGSSHVKIFSGKDGSLLASQIMFPGFQGGVNLGVGDFNGNGVPNLAIGAGPGAGPHVLVVELMQGQLETVDSFFAYDEGFAGGVNVAGGPLFNTNNRGAFNLVTTPGTGGAAHVRIFEYDGGTRTMMGNFIVGDSADISGFAVAAITGVYIDGVLALTRSGGTANGVVTMVTLAESESSISAAATHDLTLAGFNGLVLLAGGGFVYPTTPTFFAASAGGETVFVFGAEGDKTFLTVAEYSQIFSSSKFTIPTTPSNPDALAALNPFGTEVVLPLSTGGTYTVISEFAPINMVQLPSWYYRSPYTLLTPMIDLNPDLIADYHQAPRNDPTQWIGNDNGPNDPYGPDQALFSVPAQFDFSNLGVSVEVLAERLVAAAQLLLGIPYQNHHVPSWVPEFDQVNWRPVPVLRETPGVDCSDFTAFLYNFALGIELKTSPATQMAATTATQMVEGMAQPVPITITQNPKPATFAELQNLLMPGDLIFVDGTAPNPTGPSTPGHVIMWLGSLGVSPDGTPLVVDCTGPEHVDSNGVHVPNGVHIRPLMEQGANSWYWTDMLGWSRILPYGPV